jgi:hypothetical protein
MAGNILQVKEQIYFDETINKIEVHPHQPYANSSFKNNDEIRIPIQHQDIYTYPCNSTLYIEGELEAINTSFINNGYAFLFDEIRYEIGGVEIDRVKNVGITSTIKGYLSYNDGGIKTLTNAGWTVKKGGLLSLQSDSKNPAHYYFNVCIPLKSLLGFAEDYNKIILNVKQELILIRSRTDLNAVFGEAKSTGTGTTATTTEPSVNINIKKIQWRVPYVFPSDEEKLSLLKVIEKNQSIYMNFRTWELYEYPLLPQSSRQTWNVKTTTQLEKPRYVVLAFQTDRINNIKKNASEFDICSISDVKLYLNSECYPYDDMNLDPSKNQLALLYEMYVKFQENYYFKRGEPLFSYEEFVKYAPLVVIDCTRQNESIKSGPVDIRLEFETKTPIPDKTTAYCLILHDRLIEYNPMTSVVKKIV